MRKHVWKQKALVLAKYVLKNQDGGEQPSMNVSESLSN